MKKIIAVILTIVCLLTLPACQSGGQESSAHTMKAATDEGVKELPVVTVLVDLCQSDLTTTAVSDLLNSAPGYGEEFMIATETLPDFWTSDEQRQAALTQLKTEILAGKGPDVFLCENPIMENGNVGGAVFEFPRQAMDSHLLLPLDQYIEGSERLEWDRLAPRIMEAGKNGEGQHILPLTFGFDVMCFNKENFTLEAELPMTSDEMLESSDPMVRYTRMFRMGVRSVFGQIEDYERDELLVSEEEIAARIEQFSGLDEEFPQFQLSDPINQRSILGNYAMGGTAKTGLGGGDYWLVPRYNVEGGITATVGAFAAINRNTKLPGKSFKVLETLLTSTGQTSELLKQLNGQPVHMGVPCAVWTNTEGNQEQFSALLEQINAAVFRTPVEQEFDRLTRDVNAAEGGDIEDIVHEHYMKMQMMLAES